MESLVTGGLGFLGSHLVDRLLAEGEKVTLVDNLSSSVVPVEQYEKQCEVVIQDVVDYQPTKRFDRIYHLASIVGPAGVLPYGGFLGYKIARETIKVLETTTAMGARLLLVSTSEVYGQPGVLAETTPKVVQAATSPRMEYALGKLLSEVMALNQQRIKGLTVNIIRPFNIVGPRQSSRGGFVLPRFVEAALAGKPITVFGDGSQARAFTHVLDVVDSLVTVIRSSCNGEVFNVGNANNVVTVKELAHLVKQVTESTSEILYVDPKTIFGPLYEEAFDKLPDASKIREVVGWRAKIDLHTTIKETIDVIRQSLSVPKDRVPAS